MFLLSEILDAKEAADTADSQVYKEIAPEQQGAPDSHAFWDDVFAEAKREVPFSEEELFAEAFDCDPEDFSFFFQFDKEVDRILTKFDPENWASLSDEERISAIKEFADLLADRLGLDEAPEIVFFDTPPEELGAFVPGENVVKLNALYLDDAKEMVDTIPHELRHAYQHQRASSPVTKQDYAFKYNIENYITPGVDKNGFWHSFSDYQDQLVEADARAFANLFSNREVGSC